MADPISQYRISSGDIVNVLECEGGTNISFAVDRLSQDADYERLCVLRDVLCDVDHSRWNPVDFLINDINQALFDIMVNDYKELDEVRALEMAQDLAYNSACFYRDKAFNLEEPIEEKGDTLTLSPERHFWSYEIAKHIQGELPNRRAILGAKLARDNWIAKFEELSREYEKELEETPDTIDSAVWVLYNGPIEPEVSRTYQ